MNSKEIRIGEKERGQISADGCRCLKVGGEEREREKRRAGRKKGEEGLGMKGMVKRGGRESKGGGRFREERGRFGEE